MVMQMLYPTKVQVFYCADAKKIRKEGIFCMIISMLRAS